METSINEKEINFVAFFNYIIMGTYLSEMHLYGFWVWKEELFDCHKRPLKKRLNIQN